MDELDRSGSSRRSLIGGVLGGAALAATSGVLNPEEAAAATSDVFFNVCEPPYGAQGNGVADDTAAIQAALDDAGTTTVGSVKGGIVIAPKGAYLVSSQLEVPNRVQLVGVGRGSTQINADPANFPSNTAVVRLGRASAGGLTFGNRVENLSISGGGVAGSTGIFSDEIQEQSGVYRVAVGSCKRYGIHIKTPASSTLIDTVEITAAARIAMAAGVFYDTARGQNICRYLTFNSSDSTESAVGIHAKGASDVQVYSCHVEDCSDGLLFDPASTGTVIGLYGHNSVSGALVRRRTEAPVSVFDLLPNGGASLIDESAPNRNLSNVPVGSYDTHPVARGVTHLSLAQIVHQAPGSRSQRNPLPIR